MKVRLIQLTPDPLNIMTLACRTCYSTLEKELKQLNEMEEKIKETDTDLEITVTKNQYMIFNKDIKLIKNVLKRGHLSIAEHVYTSWLITGVSRALSHQLVRQRVCTFSQQSQRYVEGKYFSTINPLDIDPNKYPDLTIEDYHELIRELNSFNKIVTNIYKKLRSYGLKKEDARYVFPNATTTNLLMSCNLRELMHIFNIRCCERAQTEIRTMANKMKEIISNKIPELKEFFGPKCEVINQKCFEQDECPKFNKSKE